MKRQSAKSQGGASEEDYERGWEFFSGEGRRKNYRKAYPLLLRAAKEGVRHAQNLVGVCLDNGLGCERDPRKAMRWYRRASDSRFQSGCHVRSRRGSS